MTSCLSLFVVSTPQASAKINKDVSGRKVVKLEVPKLSTKYSLKGAPACEKRREQLNAWFDASLALDKEVFSNSPLVKLFFSEVVFYPLKFIA